MYKLIIIAIIFVAIGAAIATLLIPQLNTAPKSSSQVEGAVAPSPTVRKDYQLELAAWIPDWATASGFESLKTKTEIITTISPVWYEVNPDGSLKRKLPANSQEILKFSKDHKVKVVPAIAMFDHDLFSLVLETPANFQNHVAAIMSEVNNNGYDGIDLDYESTKLIDKDLYFQFLITLAKQLHSAGKTLELSVLAKWTDDLVYPSLPETRQVQDWTELGKIADEIRIMAYDYTSASAKYPGPIAPVSWVEDVLKYAVTKLDPAKISLGVPLYSYEWSSDTQTPFFQPDFMANATAESVKAASYNFDTVSKIITMNKGETLDFEGEKLFMYKQQSGAVTSYRMLIYMDQNGIAQREALAKKYGLKGVVFWRLGGDGKLLQN
jgi:spore germination protein YaaH